MELSIWGIQKRRSKDYLFETEGVLYIDKDNTFDSWLSSLSTKIITKIKFMFVQTHSWRFSAVIVIYVLDFVCTWCMCYSSINNLNKRILKIDK